MVSDVAADEPPAITAVQELCAADKPPNTYPVHEVCDGDDHLAGGKLPDLSAGDDHPAVGRVPDLLVGKDARHAGGCSNTDTEYPNELNINDDTSDSNSDDDNINEDQTFQGNVSEGEATNVDLTEMEASDGILFDGILRTMLQKSIQRKQRRKVLKEQSNKRSRSRMGMRKECMNKGRAAAYSRFSIGYFAKIVEIVCKSNYKMDLVKNYGFGYLLEIDDCCVPRPFAQWVADHISTRDETIVLRGKFIPLNTEAVSLVLGIPAGNIPISTKDEESGKTEFLALFGLTQVPPISFFGNKLMTEDLSDEEYVRCFLTIALGTFLCPTSNTKPSKKYMGALVDVSTLKNMNWCSFVHTWNMCYIRKYQKEKEKEKRITTTLGGCIYHLAIKDESETCYAEKDGGWASTAKNSNTRKAIEKALGNSFPDNVKEDIFLKFQERMKDENLTHV